MRDPDVLRPVFCSQFPDREGPADLCGPASLIHWISMATCMESQDLPTGNIMGPMALRRQRDRLQDSLGPAAIGGTTIDQLAAAAKKEWPYLPSMPIDRGIPWVDVWAHLKEGFCMLLVGKLADAPEGSKLRRYGGTGGHWITALRAKAGAALIYNSLATSPSYRGEWVPEADLRAFVYKTGNRVHQIGLVEAGSWSQAALSNADAAMRLKEVRREYQAKVDALSAQLRPIEEAVATARDDALRQAADAIEALR